MTKIIALVAFILAAVIALCCLFGCGGNNEPEPVSTTVPVDDGGDVPAMGGWTLAQMNEVTLPEGAAAAFEKVNAALDGASYTPVALLGTQVVAGLNYAVLCTQTTATATPITALKVVIIYAALDGTAEITQVSDFNIGTYNTGNVDWAVNAEQLNGGWTADSESIAFTDGETAAAFADIQPDGLTVTPLAKLATQVVAGTNAAYLARVTDGDGNAALKAVIIYTDLSGSSSVTAAETLNIGDYNQ